MSTVRVSPISAGICMAGFVVFAIGTSRAMADASVCDPSSLPEGAWIAYGGGRCGNFHLAWGNSGTDRARFDPNIPRDTYLRAEHRFNRRSTGDTGATHSIIHDGGTSTVNVNQSGSGAATIDLGDYRFSGNNDYFEVSSAGGGAMDTIADQGYFISLLDATYDTREVHGSMYLGNVYYWKYALDNVGDVAWSTSANDELRRTAGSITGPGWIDSDSIVEVACASGSTATIWFNMRPTAVVTSQSQAFQMVRSGLMNYGDESGTNSNMAVTVTTSRKAPWAHNYADDGNKKKGETVRFTVEGSDSFADSNTYSWDFDSAYAQGWSVSANSTVTQEDANDRLKVSITGGDPSIQSSPNLAINTTANKYLAVRMWASGGSTAKLYWANESGSWSESRQIEWNISGDSAWHEYLVYLPDGTGWGGTVNRLRFDVINAGAASGQTAYIDYIRIYDQTKMNAKIWLGTADGTWDVYSSTAMSWDAANRQWYMDYTIAGNYPQKYYVVLRSYNDAGTQCENNSRKYGDGTANREYAMANTAPTADNSSHSGDIWTTDNTPTLTWDYADADSNAQSHYRVQVDNNSDFSSPAIDTNDVAAGGASHTTTTLSDGTWHWRVRTKDGYDYSAWSTGTSFQVDATPPAVTVNQAVGQYDPAVVLPIQFTVTFAESVDDFDETDVTFGGTASGITYNVSGSGISYTIEVTDITNPGTVIASVGAGKAHDVAGNPNPASTSTDGSVRYAPASAPEVVSWSSVRMHGSTPMALPLDGGGPVVEARREGLRKLVIETTRPLAPADGTLDTNDVVISDAQEATYTPSQVMLTNDDYMIEVYFDGDGLPDGKSYTVGLTGKFVERDPPNREMVGGMECTVVCLTGDVNGDLMVDTIDMGAVKLHNRATANSDNFMYDINGDGKINLIDAALLRSYYGNSAP